MTRFNLQRTLSAAVLAVAMAAPLAGQAMAQPRGPHDDYRHDDYRHGDYRPPPRYYEPRHYEHHDNTGALIGGALLGLGVGAVVGSALAPPPVYAAPPPVYYAAPPVYYAPPPPVYYGY